jgi:hypothetical protein
MQQKFTLADVITLLTAISFGFVCFLGINFYTLGNTQESIIFSAIITIVLFGTAYLAKRLKRTTGNFQANFIFEIIVLVIFICFTFFVALKPFSHYFTVTSNKTDIQNKLNQSISQAQNMFNAYENYADNRKNNFQKYLESVVANQFINPNLYDSLGFGKSGVTDEKQIQTMVATMDSDLFPLNYSDTRDNNGIKQVATNWLGDGKSNINDWKPIGVVKVVAEVEKNSEEWRDELVDLSKITPFGEPNPMEFNYELSFGDAKEHLEKVSESSYFSIGLATLACLLMLFSYFITKRDSKSPICKQTARGNYDVEY